MIVNFLFLGYFTIFLVAFFGRGAFVLFFLTVFLCLTPMVRFFEPPPPPTLNMSPSFAVVTAPGLRGDIIGPLIDCILIVSGDDVWSEGTTGAAFEVLSTFAAARAAEEADAGLLTPASAFLSSAGSCAFLVSAACTAADFGRAAGTTGAAGAEEAEAGLLLIPVPAPGDTRPFLSFSYSAISSSSIAASASACRLSSGDNFAHSSSLAASLASLSGRSAINFVLTTFGNGAEGAGGAATAGGAAAAATGGLGRSF